MKSLYPYQTPQVRDLAWSCFSSSLLSMTGHEQVAGCALELTPARQAWLQQLDRDATPLLDFLTRHPATRLGLYFEALWHFFLQQDPRTELIAHNLPVIDQGRTLGEFDCLYYCRQRRRHVHLELAVKLYLHYAPQNVTGSHSAMSEWLGPNSRDRLDLKVKHLLGRQIRLGDRAASRQLLAGLGIGELDREVVLKGYLFDHHQHPATLPEEIDPQARPAPWLRLSELPDFLQRHQHHCCYRPLARLRWLAPANSNDPGKSFDQGQLKTALEQMMARNHRPVLVAALDGSGREYLRFFVTGADWPCPGGNTG